MNERIKELALQAMTYVTHNPKANKLNSGDMFDEKFAKLIVTECATIITDIPSSPQGSWSDGYYEGCTDSAKQIKKHFGVEL